GRADERVADGSERMSRSLTAGGAEDDRVVLGELLSDHARGIARPRDETLDALVVRALPEKLVQGRALPTATLLRDMEQRDRAVVRLRELDAEPRCELGVPAPADRHEDAASARRRALDDGDVRGRVATTAAGVGLRGRERVLARHLDDRCEDDLAVAR